MYQRPQDLIKLATISLKKLQFPFQNPLVNYLISLLVLVSSLISSTTVQGIQIYSKLCSLIVSSATI